MMTTAKKKAIMTVIEVVKRVRKAETDKKKKSDFVDDEAGLH